MMKLHLAPLTLLAGLASLAISSADIPPPPPKQTPATPAAPPAAPPPVNPETAAPNPGAPQPAEGLLPPAAPAVDLNDGFKDEKERQSYALGQHFGTREKNTATSNGTTPPKPDEMVQGMLDVLKGAKSRDYAAGATLALQVIQAGMDADAEVLAASLRAAMNNEASKLNPQQLQAAMQRIQTELTAKRDARKKAELDKALAAANEFMAGNEKNEGVKKLESGLQYKLEKEGDGKAIEATDILTLKYTAKLTDGTVFEKSPDSGPAKKPIRILPQGLQDVLKTFKVGTKATVWVPPALGFGEQGRVMPQVRGNQVLIYDLEVVDSTPMPKAAANANATSPQPSGARPITATTPPISVEIPPKDGAKPAMPKVEAATPPVQVNPGGAPVPPPAPPAPPTPPPPAPEQPK